MTSYDIWQINRASSIWFATRNSTHTRKMIAAMRLARECSVLIANERARLKDRGR